MSYPLLPPACTRTTPKLVRGIINLDLLAVLLVALVALVALVGTLSAGPSVVNWLVVYDPASPHATSIAQHYQEARSIPDSHLFPYDFPKLTSGGYTVAQSMNSVQTYAFIESIRSYLAAQALEEQIGGIVLVGDTPTVFQNEAASNSFGSLTAALWHAPNATSVASLRTLIASSNQAFRGPLNGSSGELLPTVAINSQTTFNGQRYWMATHLGFTGAKGLRPDEVFTLIDRSAAADGQKTEGTVYWPLNADVRSTTRANQINLVQPEWDALGLSYLIQGQGQGGVSGQIVHFTNKTGAPGSYPAENRLVQGQIVGRATVPIEQAKNLYAPGAIAEHLTSFGGRVNALFDASQTGHLDWLRFGASGSSGTVVEPTALWEKFPHARLHSHYYRGASLAEAFIQSVKNPVQLMVSGDPLLRPFADIPAVTITAPAANTTVSGSLQVNAAATSARALDPEMDLAINGRVLRLGDPGESVTASRNATGFLIDTTTLPDGWHELRVIARNSDALQTPGAASVPIYVQNAGASLTLNAPSNVAYGEAFSASVTPTGLATATAIEIRFAGQVLASLPPAGGTTSIDAARLSYQSPSPLVAVALTLDGEVRSAPVEVTTNWAPTPAQERPVVEGAIAVVRVFSDVTSGSFDWESPADFTGLAEGYGDLSFPNPESLPFLGNASVNQAGIEFISLFYATADDFYDFAFDGAWTEASLLVNGETVIAPVNINLGHVAYGSTRLAAGWHELRIRLKPANGSMRFRPAVRARDTFFFEQYDFTRLDHTRCFAPADIELSPLALAARPQGSGQAVFNWTNPPANATGFRVERAAAAPSVSLVTYRGDKTAPTLHAANSGHALQPGAPVANDNNDVWTSLPPFLREGVRLLTAEADRTLVQTSNLLGTADLYEVSVPAGTTIYGIFHRNTPAASPQWMQAQGDWTPVSASVQSERWPDWRVWKKAPLAASGTVTLGHGDVPWGGAVSYVFINEPIWIEEGSAASGTHSLSLAGLPTEAASYRLTATLPSGIEVPSHTLILDASSSLADAPPTVFAGADQTLTFPTAAQLQGRAADDNAASLSYAWTKVSGPGDVLFAQPTALSTSATVSAPGLYTLQLAASDGGLTGSDTLVLNVQLPASANQSPTVNAGSDRSTHTAASITLAGAASDDGLPELPGKVSTFWRQLSGPAPVTLANPYLLNTPATFTQAGVYVLQLSASDGLITATDSVQITVAPDPNAAPVVDAGPDANAVPLVPFSFQATVSDDGLPNPPASLTALWRQLCGPASATLADATDVQTSVTFPEAIGSYVFELRINDGGKVTTDTVQIEVAFANEGNEAPAVSLDVSEIDAIWLDTVQVLHSVSDDGLPNPPAQLFYTWSIHDGPPGGEVRSETEADGSRSRLWFTAPGSYALTFSVSDGAVATERSLTVHAPERATRARTWYWGQNRSSTDFRLGSSGTMATDTELYPTLSARQWTRIVGHSGLSVALDRDGFVWTQGHGVDTRDDSPIGRLGDPGASPRFAYARLDSLSDIVAIANGNTFAAAVDSGGQLHTWGSNSYFQLGLGESSTAEVFNPTPVPGMDNVRNIDAGQDFFAALLHDGTVRTWGRKAFNSLGNGSDSANKGTPQNIGLSNVSALAVGDYFGLALLDDGTVRSWGRNNRGQIGNGFRDTFGSADAPTPVTVLGPNGTDPFDNVRQIAAGAEFALALRDDGTVWMWGNNEQGQAGQGNLTDKTLPTQIPGLPADIVQVAAARRTAYALAADGTVYATGSNDRQMLGLPANNPSYRASVAPVAGLPAIGELHINYRNAHAITPGFTESEFLAAHFTEAERADPAISGPDADPDRDGVPNRLERFFSTDPRSPTERSGVTTSTLPNGSVRFSLTGLTAPEGLTPRFQQSPDLSSGSWTPASPDTLEIEDHGDTRTWHFDYTIDTAEPIFFRLQLP